MTYSLIFDSKSSGSFKFLIVVRIFVSLNWKAVYFRLSYEINTASSPKILAFITAPKNSPTVEIVTWTKLFGATSLPVVINTDVCRDTAY